MAKKNGNVEPPIDKTIGATCPAEDTTTTSGEPTETVHCMPVTVPDGCQPQVASEICATAIGCDVTVPPMCVPWQHLQPAHTWFNGCGVPPVTAFCAQAAVQNTQLTHCTHVSPSIGCPPTSHPTCAPWQPLHQGMTWFHGCGVPPVTMYCAQAAALPNTQIGQCGVYPPSVGCVPNTQIGQCGVYPPSVGCNQAAVVPNTQIGQCGVYPPSVGCVPNTQIGHCGVYPPSVGCNQAAVVPNTHFAQCGVMPQTVGCVVHHTQPGQCAEPHTIRCVVHTTQVANYAVPNTVGCVVHFTHNGQCGHVHHTMGCPPVASPQAQTIGHTGWYTCAHTVATVCTQGIHPVDTTIRSTYQHDCTTAAANNAFTNTATTTVQTHSPQCNAATMTVHPTFVCGGGHANYINTATTTVQTQAQHCNTATKTAQHTQQVGCGTGAAEQLGHTGWYTCPGTFATVCTEKGCGSGCQNETKLGPTAWLTCVCPQNNAVGCHLSILPQSVGCVETGVTKCHCGPGPESVPPGCPPANLAAAPIAPTAVYGCTQGTAATVCTQHDCRGYNTHQITCVCPQGAANVGPTGWYTCAQAVQGTAATVCTQVACQTLPVQICDPVKGSSAAGICTLNCGTGPQANMVTVGACASWAATCVC